MKSGVWSEGIAKYGGVGTKLFPLLFPIVAIVGTLLIDILFGM